jgi:RNA polymerase sigma factor (sigma-70 family)
MGKVMSTEAITPEDLLAHSAWLQRLAARLVEPSSAEDLVQETWATAVRAQPDRSRPLRPWLAEVLRNLARMRARGAARWRTRAEKVRAADDVALPTPEELMTYHEAQRMVAEEVAGLQEPFRSAVLLCYGQGMEPSEIARRLSIPAGTVRWRLKRGLDDVRARLDARYGHDRRAWCVALAPVAARGLVTGAGAAATIGLRGFGLKAAVALLAVAVLGVAALRWSGAKESGADLAAAGEPEKLQLAPARRLAPATPSPGGPGAGRPGRPPNLAPALAGAAAAAPEPGRLDVTEALARAAEPGDSPSRGNPKALVTIVIYSEFQCPFCGRVNPTLGELQALYPQEVRFVWKHLPLPFHESAGLASEAALAAAEQGKFWQMHDRLFANQDKLDPPSLSEHAQAIGLDVGKFKAALDSGKFRQRIETDLKLAKDANIKGTPTFLVNGELLVGAQPLPAFKHKVEEALAKAKGLPPPKPLVPSGPPPTAGKPGLPRGPIMSPFWPPPRVALPDALLGDRLAAPVTIGNAPMKGQAKAPVEVLYFTTLSGGESTRAAQIADGLLATYGQHLRLYAKVIPRAKPGEPGPLVAEAALAAHAAGKFWPFHDALTRGQFGFPDDDRIEKAARDAGLDEGELKVALSSGRYRARALEEGEALRGVRFGDYAFVVNGRMAEGTTALVHLVEAAIKKAGRKPPPWPGPPGAKDPNQLYGLKMPPGETPPVRMNVPFLNLSPRQTFAIEPRDEAWAAPIEKALGPIIEKDLRTVEPKVAGSALECRSTLCRLTWRPGKGDPKLLAGAVSFMYMVPGGSRPGGPNEQYLVLRGSVGGTERGQNAEGAIAAVKSRRNTVLYNVRTGRANAPASVPAERLPKE